MPSERAHDLENQERTRDVITDDGITFRELLLSENTLAGLDAAGFKRPSPIQRKAIPLGRCGFDLIVQAKSGTGKTCVFSIVALEMLRTDLDRLQVLILSPTREISVQIKDVIAAIGQGFKGLKVKAFIGGLPLKDDKKNLQGCQIAVGAPGRVKHLISQGLMKVDAVRLFVLDEADKLMEESFRSDISFIFLQLPKTKQTIASSATYPPALEEFLSRYTNNPTRISLGHGIFLKGIRQFVSVVERHPNLLNQTRIKEGELLWILHNVSFKQCLIFSNYQSRVESLCNRLKKEGFPTLYISGSQIQTDRLQSITNLKEFACRILVTTDLTSRGIDAENVNLVINMDVPYDSSTYMHRIGRAGRYGTQGLAVTIVETGSECQRFRRMLHEIGGSNFQISVFPRKIYNADIWKMNVDEFEKMSVEEDGKEIDSKPIKNAGECKMEKFVDRGETKENAESPEEKICEEWTLRCIIKLIVYHNNLKNEVKLNSFWDFVMQKVEFDELPEESLVSPVPSKNDSGQIEKFPKILLSVLKDLEKKDWNQFEMKLKERKADCGHLKPVYRDESEDRKETEDASGPRTFVREEKEKGLTPSGIEKSKDPSEVVKKVFGLESSESEENDESEDGKETEDADESEEIYSEEEEFNGSLNDHWYATWQAQDRAVREYVNFVARFYSAGLHSFA